MTSKTKLFIPITLLFLGSSLLLFFMDTRQSIQAGNGGLPYPMLSFMVMCMLYLSITVLLTGTLRGLTSSIKTYEQQLTDANTSLEETTRNLEERVERRTFEIAVANASLNREIAERIQAETATKRIKRRMELILESAGEGIFGLDADGKVSFVNRAASRMLGWEPEELTGKPHHTLVHHSRADGSPYPEEDCPIHQAYRDGKVHHGTDELFWTKSGKGFGVEYISTPIVENKRLAGAVVVFRNLAPHHENRTIQQGEQHA